VAVAFSALRVRARGQPPPAPACSPSAPA